MEAGNSSVNKSARRHIPLIVAAVLVAASIITVLLVMSVRRINEVEAVIAKIQAVDADSRESVTNAQAVYNKLLGIEKIFVDNKSVYKKAVSDYGAISAEITDTKRLISAIVMNDEASITVARAAYEKLNECSQKHVTNTANLLYYESEYAKHLVECARIELLTSIENGFVNGDYTSAISYSEQYIEEHGADAVVIDYAAKSLLHLASEASSNKDYEKAIELLTTAYERFGGSSVNDDVYSRLGIYHRNVVVAAYDAKEYDEVMDLTDRFRWDLPGHYMFDDVFGFVIQGAFDKAKSYVDDNDYYAAVLLLIDVYERYRDFEASNVIVAQRKEYATIGANIMIDEAKVLAEEGQYSKALDVLQRAYSKYCLGLREVSEVIDELALEYNARILIDEAKALADEGDYEQAFYKLNMALVRYGVPNVLPTIEDLIDAYTKKLEKLRPRNGKIFENKLRSGICQVRITADSCDIYVRLISVSNPSRYLDFYVREGKTATITVAEGEYTIKYALGETWYGTDYYFGKHTFYYDVNESFKLSITYSGYYVYYDIMHITIGFGMGGDLDINPISRDSFED